MDIGRLLDLQLRMLTYFLMGAALKKLHILRADGIAAITDLILHLVLPCNIIAAFLIPFDLQTLKQFGIILLIATFIQIYSFLISKILYKKEPEEVQKALRYATMVSNAGFIGNPVAESFFGPAGLLYASIYLIPQRIVMWSAGLSIYTGSHNSRETLHRVLTHPCIIAVFIGSFLMLTGLPLPEFLREAVESVGDITTPFSLILIGTILADVDPGSLLDSRLLGYSILRLLILPAIALLVCKIFAVDRLISGVSVLLAAMPASTSSVILANKYHGDAKFASKLVMSSTLAILLTLPLWSYLFSLFL